MNIPKFSIKNYQFTITLFAFLLAMGLSSFFSMPQSEDPMLDIPAVMVVSIYPGAMPRDIESQVVDPIEEALNELDDVKEIRTDISDGVAVTEVEFFFGVDPDEKFDDVQAQVSGLKSELPEDLYQIDFIKQSTSTVAIFQLALVSERASYGAMKTEAERLKKIIEKVSGVRKVEILAYPEKEVRLALNPIKMAAMNISLDDVEKVIQSSNATIPGGAIKVSRKLFNVKTSGAYNDLEEIKNTVVGNHMDKIVYLKNIASVYFDYEDERYTARFNGKRSIFMAVQQKEGFNIFDVAGPIREKLGQVRIAGDMELAYVFDQSSGVENRVSGFINNLLQGIVLVGLIILLLLGFRSSGIVMTAIPLSIIIGLAVVGYFDLGLQQMSIAGLVVALGLLVDNSIAIIENINRFLNMGLSPKEAAIKGTSQLIAPMFSATLTTILAFVPIVMMPETTGEFIKALPVTVIATLSASLLIAVTLTPFIASKVLKNNGTAQKETFSFKALKSFVQGPYRNTMNWVFQHRALSISIAVASFIGSMMLFPYVGISFFPKAEKPQFRITVNLPNGSNLYATDEAVKYVENVLKDYEEIDYYASNIGKGNPRIYYNINPQNYSNSYGELLVILKEYEPDAFYALLDELRARFSGYSSATINVREFVQGPPSEAPIAVKIYGNDLDQLEEYARQVEHIAKENPGAINVDNPLSTNSTDIYFDINRDKAMMYDVPVYRIDKTIRSFVNGNTVAKFRDSDAEEYNIVLRYDFTDQFQIEDFDKIRVKSMNGRFIPLKQLANMEFSKSPTQIAHLKTDRVASILADVTNGYTLDEVVASMKSEMDQLDWADGYSYEFKGDLESREESFGGLGTASVMALILILGVLIIQFKSFTQPLIIFSALPLAIIGSILMLLITSVSFSFTAFIGLVSLIGIAINNSIILVDYANELRKEGKSVAEAAKLAGEVRFIPIVMTTLTTILGLLPLTLAGGSMWAPMGWTIIGGLLTSTFFVLLLVPVLYQLLTKEEGLTGA